MIMAQLSTRNRVLAVAGDLFYSQGIRNVGVDAVCKEAGVTKPTLYHHFGSKDGLVAAYLEDRNESIFVNLKNAADQTDGPVSAKIAALFERLAKVSPRPSWKGCPLLRGAAEFANDVDHPARKISSAHKKRVESWLTELLAEHGVTAANVLARQLTVLLDGAVMHVFLHGDPSYARSSGMAARTLVEAALKEKPASI
jgi:AcrR family transcriptional regulator